MPCFKSSKKSIVILGTLALVSLFIFGNLGNSIGGNSLDGTGPDNRVIQSSIEPPVSNQPANQTVYLNEPNVTIIWIITDPDTSFGDYLILKDVASFDESTIMNNLDNLRTWYNNSAITYNVDTSDPGLHNYTIGFIDDIDYGEMTVNFGYSVVWIDIKDTPYIQTQDEMRIHVNEVVDFNLTIIDSDSSSGSLKVYNNSNLINDTSWTNDSLFQIPLNTSQEGQYNFSVICDDGITPQQQKDSLVWIASSFPPEILGLRNHTVSLLLPVLELNFNITDLENTTGNYSILREGASFNASYNNVTWSNGITNTAYLLLGSAGQHNFTIIAEDLVGNTTVVDFYVFVNTPAVVNDPIDNTIYDIDEGPFFTWNVTDIDNTTGSFTVEKDGNPMTSQINVNSSLYNYFNEPWINGSLIPFYDIKGAGTYNYTIFVDDGITIVQQTTIITIIKTRASQFDDITLTILLSAFIAIGLIGAILLIVKKPN